MMEFENTHLRNHVSLGVASTVLLLPVLVFHFHRPPVLHCPRQINSQHYHTLNGSFHFNTPHLVAQYLVLQRLSLTTLQPPSNQQLVAHLNTYTLDLGRLSFFHRQIEAEHLEESLVSY
jgi:hypothetical protein